ncbi:MAG: Holliday junction resolvase RuvX [Crocinitomicaceae bacterium]|nr:Holliday junction resolvase RuvX [Crocinitomicaceae bacterium]|tara:strand:+ start:1876 stop:2286 length:411 start_codon:yes stop_codon:yes gene_type:complete
MSKAIGIDFGLKRTGISISDELGIIATPLKTVSSSDLMQFLKDTVLSENVETMVLGFPLGLNGADTDVTQNVRLLKLALEKQFPLLQIALFDERMTSKIAQRTLIQGASKKKRKQKGLIDQMSATIILQDYLNSKS